MFVTEIISAPQIIRVWTSAAQGNGIYEIVILFLCILLLLFQYFQLYLRKFAHSVILVCIVSVRIGLMTCVVERSPFCGPKPPSNTPNGLPGTPKLDRHERGRSFPRRPALFSCRRPELSVLRKSTCMLYPCTRMSRTAKSAQMARVLHRLGTGLVFLGFCMAAAGILIAALDVVVWMISGHWQSTSLWSLFGALRAHPFSNW